MRNRSSQNVRPDEPSLISGRWYGPYTRSASNTWSFALNTGFVALSPMIIPDDTRISALAIRTTTAESVAGIIALYRSNDLGLPQSLAVSGQVTLGGAAGVRSVNVNAMLPQGLYWAGLFSAGVSAVVRAVTIENAIAARYIGYADNSSTTPGASIVFGFTSPPATIDASTGVYSTAAPPQIMVRVA